MEIGRRPKMKGSVFQAAICSCYVIKFQVSGIFIATPPLRKAIAVGRSPLAQENRFCMAKSLDKRIITDVVP